MSEMKFHRGPICFWGNGAACTFTHALTIYLYHAVRFTEKRYKKISLARLIVLQSKMMGMPAPVDPEVKHAMKLQGIFMGAAALIAIGLIRIAPAGLQAVGMASE